MCHTGIVEDTAVVLSEQSYHGGCFVCMVGVDCGRNVFHIYFFRIVRRTWQTRLFLLLTMEAFSVLIVILEGGMHDQIRNITPGTKVE